MNTKELGPVASEGMNAFILSLKVMGIPFVQKPLGPYITIDIPLAQRQTEGLRFVFHDGVYCNHRIQKV